MYPEEIEKSVERIERHRKSARIFLKMIHDYAREKSQEFHCDVPEFHAAGFMLTISRVKVLVRPETRVLSVEENGSAQFASAIHAYAEVEVDGKEKMIPLMAREYVPASPSTPVDEGYGLCFFMELFDALFANQEIYFS